MTEPKNIPTFSNSIRLNGRQWLIVGLFGFVLVAFASPLWKRLETFAPAPEYRMPHELSNDYWLYERFAGLAAERFDTLVIGDSVVWGEYVIPQETLSHYLNAQSGKERFANLGLDGAHPLALAGLVEHYAGSVADKNVLLQCNPLWMSTLKTDLQDEKLTDFNHPRLAPQFFPRIPSYKEEVSTRLGVLVEQRLAFNKWTNHLQQAYYERTDIPGWTMVHPYDNPLKPLTRGLPSSSRERRHPAKPWFQSKITSQDYPWVNIETSLQWQAFRGVVKVLQGRGNRVFVLVGPFNEHMLTPASLKRYEKIKNSIGQWFKDQEIPHLVPAVLPSVQYGDASHPLAPGYRALARLLLEDPGFAKFHSACGLALAEGLFER